MNALNGERTRVGDAEQCLRVPKQTCDEINTPLTKELLFTVHGICQSYIGLCIKRSTEED